MKTNHKHKKNPEQKSFFKEHGAAWAVGLAIIIILATLLSVFNVPLAGKAVDTPALTTFNLDRQAEVVLNLAVNPSWKIDLKGSGMTAPLTLDMAATILETCLVNYTLTDVSQVYAAGILSTTLTSPGPIFLDNGDNVADLELTLSGTQLTVKNPNYVSPSDSRFILFDKDWRLVSNLDKVIYVNNGGLNTYYINVTTTTGQPTVTGSFLGTTNSSFELNRSGSNFQTWQLNLTPNEIKPYVFTLSSDVSGKISTETYTFASNGLLYELNETGLPVVQFFKSGTTPAGYSLALTFDNVAELQPFSLPCAPLNQVESNKILVPNGQVFGVYTYIDGRISQWSDGATYDLNSLSTQKSYLLKTKENLVDPTVKFNLNCVSTFEEGLPNLAEGWNLISVSGYKSQAKSELDKKIPAGRRIVKVLEVKRNEVTVELTSPSSPLIPGKAYWVEVR